MEIKYPVSEECCKNCIWHEYDGICHSTEDMYMRCLAYYDKCD